LASQPHALASDERDLGLGGPPKLPLHPVEVSVEVLADAKADGLAVAALEADRLLAA